VDHGQIHVVALGANRAGGAEVYTSNLVSKLSSRGYSVKLICHQADSEVDAICSVQRIGWPSFHNTPVAWRISALYDLYYYRKRISLLRGEKPRLIIASAQYPSWAYSKAYSDVPLVYVPHSLVAAHEVQNYPWDSPIHSFVSTNVVKYLERWLLRRAVRTVRFTHFCCEELLKYHGEQLRSRFAVFPPAVPLPPRPEKRKSNGPVQLLFIGRLVQSKNVDFLLSALSQIQDLAWRLDIVGDGPERKALEGLAKRYGMADRVVFHGHSADVSKWYMSAELLAFPSRLESVGLVILEAMSFGVPAVTIRSNGHDYLNGFHEFITDGKNGFIADDEPGFVSKLVTLISNRTILAEAGYRARLKVEEKNNWDYHISCYERLFSEILAGDFRS
jgi:glycosyltransferase involved in cell wall biosynthesis